MGDPEHPNLSPTYWRSVADSTNKIYYFESALSPNIVWVNLNKIDLGPGSGVRAVKVEENYSVIGNIDDALAPVAPISYLAPTAANAVQPPAAPAVEKKVGFTGWLLIGGAALVAAIALLPRALRRT